MLVGGKLVGILLEVSPQLESHREGVGLECWAVGVDPASASPLPSALHA